MAKRSPPPPVVLAMVLCADVLRPTPRSRATIVDVLWNITDVPKFPVYLKRFKVYVAVTAIRGPLDLTLQLAPSDLSRPAQSMDMKGIAAASPVDARELVVTPSAWEISSAGEWVFDLTYGGEILVSRRMRWSLERSRP